MEEVKSRKPIPYQRVTMGDELREAFGHLDLSQEPRQFLHALSQKNPSPTNVQLMPTFEENSTQKSFICENPTFNIRETDKSSRNKQVPGYIRANYALNPETQKHELDSLECSNADIHDAIFNPEKFSASKSIAAQPEVVSISPLEMEEMSKQLHERKNKNFEQLRLKMKTEKVGNTTPFDKDKNRCIQTYGSSAFEEKVSAYYCQEMLSLCDIVVDPQVFVDRKRKELLSTKTLSVSGQNNVIVNEQERSLSVEQSNLSVTHTEPKTGESITFTLTGKLRLEYHLDEEEGFKLSGAKSDNPELVKFFKYLFFAPQLFTPEKCREFQLNSFIEEPAKIISSKEELLRLVPEEGEIRQSVAMGLQKIMEPATGRDKKFELDVERSIIIEPSVTQPTIQAMKRFWSQEILSLNTRISSYPLCLKFDAPKNEAEKPTKIYAKNGKTFITTTLVDPKYSVSSPYGVEADYCYFKGMISLTYEFNEKTGFSLVNLSFSNNILYNLTFNSHKLFPTAPQSDNPVLEKQFLSEIKRLEAEATEQEENKQAKPLSATHSPSINLRNH